jgi:hypothetical protein
LTVVSTKLLLESFSIVVWQVNNVQLQVGLRKMGALPALLYTSFLAWWLIKPRCRRCNVWTPVGLDFMWKCRFVSDVEVTNVVSGIHQDVGNGRNICYSLLKNYFCLGCNL